MGLLALMLLHESRRAARTSPGGDLILLEDQDRANGTGRSIAEGVALVERALASRRFGPYSLQAAISALHAEARTPEATDWPQIVALYDVLAGLDPSPVIALNRAVAVAMRDGPAAGLALVEEILGRGDLGDYHLETRRPRRPVPPARGDLRSALPMSGPWPSHGRNPSVDSSQRLSGEAPGLSERRGPLALKWGGAMSPPGACRNALVATPGAPELRRGRDAHRRRPGASDVRGRDGARGARGRLAPRDVQSALWRERTLKKTWLMRGTLHLVPAVVAPLYVAARVRMERAAPQGAPLGKVLRALRHQGGAVRAFIACIPQILAAEPMTREQLAMAAAKHIRAPRLPGCSLELGFALEARRGAALLRSEPGSQRHLRQPGALDRRARAARPAQRAAADRPALSRAYGPATARDFALWWGFGLAPARKIFQSMEDEIETVEVEGWQALRAARTLGADAKARNNGSRQPAAAFRCLRDGHRARRLHRAAVAKRYQARVLRPQGWISAVVLVDGYFKGVWSLNRGPESDCQRPHVLAAVRSVRGG